MNWSHPIFIVSGATGASFLLASLVGMVWPAKKINSLYGYRSRRSMHSQEAWDFAQQYANKLLVVIGVLNLSFGLSGSFMLLSDLYSVVLSLLFMFLTLLWLFWKTDRVLKNRYW